MLQELLCYQHTSTPALLLSQELASWQDSLDTSQGGTTQGGAGGDKSRETPKTSAEGTGHSLPEQIQLYHSIFNTLSASNRSLQAKLETLTREIAVS